MTQFTIKINGEVQNIPAISPLLYPRQISILENAIYAAKRLAAELSSSVPIEIYNDVGKKVAEVEIAIRKFF